MNRTADPGLAFRVVVRTIGELSITLGTVTLLFVAWQLWWTDIEANREQSQLTSGLEAQWSQGVTDDSTAQPPAIETAPVTPDATTGEVRAPLAPSGEAFAIIRIPTLGEDYEEPILAGTATATLQKGIGHYEGTAGPGEIGNFAVAGHRTTYGAPFSRVDELRAGDPIVVQTADRYYVYRVSSTEIVSPQDIDVIAPVPDEPGVVPTGAFLTLTTCHPKYSARQRYIVHGTFVAAAATPADVTAALIQG